MEVEQFAHENIASQKESSLPTIHFSGASGYVKLREGRQFFSEKPLEMMGLRSYAMLCALGPWKQKKVHRN